MPIKFWWPTTMSAKLVVVQNIKAKIGLYQSVLPLTPGQVSAAEKMCDGFVAAVTATDQCRQTMQAMTAWRDEILYGEPSGGAAPAPPTFAAPPSGGYSLGIVKQLLELRDLIVASPGYTEAIGEDLGIVGSEEPKKPASDYTPQLKTTTSAGYQINISGSMQGMDALRVEYARKGGTFQTVAFLTNTPGGFSVVPATPGQPETGHVRAVFIKKNEEFGNYSADYPVTIS